MTPDNWRRHNEWKYGPTKLVVSERPDPIQLPETAGEPDKDKVNDAALLLLVVGILAILCLVAVFGPPAWAR